MPFTIAWEPSGTYTRFTGEVAGEEIIAHSGELQGDARFDTIRYVIADFLEAEVSITLDQVREIAAIDAIAARSNPRIRVGIVSGGETMDAGGALYKAEHADSPWIQVSWETTRQ